MKVTIEVGNREQALELLQGQAYLHLLEDFVDWLEGEGREESARNVGIKLSKLATIHGVVLT